MKSQFLEMILISCLMTACSPYKVTVTEPQPMPHAPEEQPQVLTSDTACDLTNAEANLKNRLAAAVTDTDFTLILQRGDAKQFVFSRGQSTAETIYQSASTSKMITAAVILRQVEKGLLKLSDRPQKYIASWPIPSTDSLYTMTLSDLLSFTSGLEKAPICTDNPYAKFNDCVLNIATANLGNGRIPGKTYFYESTHLQVAGAMAVQAAKKSSWAELFNEFKNETGLFTVTKYNLPSLTNPRLAGGASWSANEYLEFLLAYRDGKIISPLMFNFATSDRIADAKIISAPALEVIGEAWHYGYGLWVECHAASYNCTETKVVSSPGAYGAYPFIDVQTKLTGILARQGELRTFKNGYDLFSSVEKEIREWETCVE